MNRPAPISSGTRVVIGGLHTTILGHTWIGHLAAWSYRIAHDRSVIRGQANFHILHHEVVTSV